ncbi:MAG: methionine--tRNA ligase subunit beta, partial [Thermodesulfobacteriota bacterium]|nr:methionine--tRNA ligase subunit beta [Thermodesulfobacteriota bacterium]
LIAVWELINQANKFIDREAPWTLAKDPDSKERLAGVLYQLLETLGLIAGLISPVMPDTAQEMRRQIGLPDGFLSLDPEEIEQALPPGQAVNQGQALFPRVEIGGVSAVQKGKPKPAAKPEKKEKPEAGLVSFEEFKKLDLRVGLVKAAERVPKSKKLIKMIVDLGEERTIVAGVGQNFTPEELVGERVVILANLAPAKLMGVTSEGMMLAASDKDGPALIVPSREAEPGSRIS